MSDFRKLKVWQRAHQFSRRVEVVARRMARRKPKLASQLERAADGVAAAIAEGRGRETDAEFAHYVTIAIGSVTEAEHHLQKAFDSALISETEHSELTTEAIEIRKMLIGLRRTLRGQPRKPKDEQPEATSSDREEPQGEPPEEEPGAEEPEP